MAGRKGMKLKSNIDAQFLNIIFIFLRIPHTSDNAYGNISIELTDPYICFFIFKMFFY